MFTMSDCPPFLLFTVRMWFVMSFYCFVNTSRNPICLIKFLSLRLFALELSHDYLLSCFDFFIVLLSKAHRLVTSCGLNNKYVVKYEAL